MMCRLPGRLIPVLLLAATLPGVRAQSRGEKPAPPAAEVKATKAAQANHRLQIWEHRIFLSVRGEPVDQLAAQVGQQLMTRVRPIEEIAHHPVSAYTADCSVAELRDGLLAGFGYDMVPYAAAESVHFHLDRAAAAKRAPAPRSKTAKPGVATRPSLPPASKDPRLLRTLDFSEVAVDDEHGGLPVILEALSQAGAISILADHAAARPATGATAPSAFLAGLKGLTVGEALDRTARAYNYRWTRAGSWFFFKPAR